MRIVETLVVDQENKRPFKWCHFIHTKASKPGMPGIDFMGTEDRSVPTQVAVMRGQERSVSPFDLRACVIPYRLKQSTHTSNAVLYQH